MTDSFSPDSNKENSNSDSEYKLPDKIIIGQQEQVEVEQETKQNKRFFSKYQSQGKESDPQEPPTSLRLISFFGLVFCLIFGVLMLVCAFISSVLSLLTFLKNSSVNQMTLRFWKLYVNTSVCAFGCLLALLNPLIGLGFLTLYFSLVGEKMDGHIIYKIFERSFRDF